MEKLKYNPIPKLKVPDDAAKMIKAVLVATGGIILIKAAADVLKS